MTFPELVIFDCDGVLIDSEPIVCQAIADILTEYGVPMSQEEAMERYIGHAHGVETSDVQERFGIVLPDDYEARKRKRITDVFAASLVAIPGVHALVAGLRCKKCIASGSTQWRLRHALGLVKLWDPFDPNVFGAEAVAVGKPAPDIFLFAAAKMAIDPSACLVIEDSIAGVKAGVAAGMRVFGFTGASHCKPGHADALYAEGAAQVFADMQSLAEAIRQSADTIAGEGPKA